MIPLVVNLRAVDWGKYNPLTIKERKALTTFLTLREMEETLKQIEATNKEIYKAENELALSSARHRKKLEDESDKLTRDLEAFTKKALEQTKLEIETLKERIARREGDIKENEEALKAKGKLVSWAETAHAWTGWGIAKTALDAAQAAEGRTKKQAEDKIAAIRKDIASIKDLLIKAEEASKGIFTSKKYVDGRKEIQDKLQKVDNSLTNINAEIKKIRTETIVNPYDIKGKQLLKQLEEQIKKADCKMITSIASTQQRNIDACKQQALETFQKTYNKYPACKQLTLTSSLEDINQCFIAVTGKPATISPGGPTK